MTLTPATRAHAPVLAALHGRAFAEVGAEPWTEETMRRVLDGPGAVGWIESADAPGVDPRGYLLGRVFAGDAELLSLGVAPDARRAGVARRLLARMVQAARAGGAEALFLEVATDNLAALALYEDQGFERVGRRAGYYRRLGGPSVDAEVLRLTLTTDSAPR